ncbi:MAG: class II fructose-bisphosphate aldolase, partial [Candidatus Poribacteria bacterium]|nr:class II fructose-bisphosphate aldolase [Candidatus Poribacteria bacterium]
IQLGIKNGVRKINVDTDSRLAMTGAIRHFLAENPAEFDPRSYLTPARDAMKEIIKSRMLSFGEVGTRVDYEPLSLESIARQYAE